LLGQILNASEDIFFAGELIDFWPRGVIQNRLCSCSQPARECEIWREVIDRIEKSVSADQIRQMSELRSQTRVGSRLAWMASQWVPNLKSGSLQLARDLTTQLYQTVADVTGAKLIVDSSKFSYVARLIAQIDMLDLHLIHLVRDPRAVAHSWKRKKRIPDPAQELFIPQFGIISSTLRWIERNYSAARVGKGNPARYSVLSYESFITKPQTSLARAWRESGLMNSGISLPELDDLSMPANHAIWGNPSRFEVGPVNLKVDDAWKDEQSSWHSMVISLLALPGLMKYGYPLVVRA
jgi:hypothetical protein